MREEDLKRIALSMAPISHWANVYNMDEDELRTLIQPILSF